MTNGHAAADDSDERLVLRQSKPSMSVVLGGLALGAAGVVGIIRHDAELWAWLVAIFFGGGALLLLVGQYWRPGKLALSRDGFSKVGILGTTSHRWQDVSAFAVRSPGYAGPRQLPDEVIFLCLPTSPVSPGKTRVLGRYGDIKPDQLAKLMNRWRSRFG